MKHMPLWQYLLHHSLLQETMSVHMGQLMQHHPTCCLSTQAMHPFAQERQLATAAWKHQPKDTTNPAEAGPSSPLA